MFVLESLRLTQAQQLLRALSTQTLPTLTLFTKVTQTFVGLVSLQSCSLTAGFYHLIIEARPIIFSSAVEGSFVFSAFSTCTG